MKGRGKSKPKKKTARKSNDQNLESSLEKVNTQTHTDELNVVADTLSTTPDTGHAVSEVSLSRRQHRPAGPERPLSSRSSSLVSSRVGGLVCDHPAGDDVVAYRTTVTRVSCSHPVSEQSDVPTRPAGNPPGANVVSAELPACQEQSGSTDDEDTVVLQSEGSLYDDLNTVPESDSDVDGSEVEVTFRSQHLQRSAADKAKNSMFDRSCEHDSSQHRSVAVNIVLCLL